jgi:hypothetical protein
MSEISRIRSDIAAAQERLDALTEAAELALDRGGRAPSPLQIAQARGMLAFFQRQLELAEGAPHALPYVQSGRS